MQSLKHVYLGPERPTVGNIRTTKNSKVRSDSASVVGVGSDSAVKPVLERVRKGKATRPAASYRADFRAIARAVADKHRDALEILAAHDRGEALASSGDDVTPHTKPPTL